MATAPDSPQAHPYGKWMVIAAWISVIGLLVIVFDGVLEN